MFKILDGSEGDVLGVEITGGYTKADVEAFKKAFNDTLGEGIERCNILVKIDEMETGESDLGAFFEDARFALKNIGKMRHIAVVGQSPIIKALVGADDFLFGDKEKELVERYFDIEDLEQAWKFVRS